jgi:hypothetical protein
MGQTMKKTAIKVVLSLVIIILGIGSFAYFWKDAIHESYKKAKVEIAAKSDTCIGFTYPYKDGHSRTIRFNLDTARSISINTWEKNLLGEVRLILQDSGQKQVISRTLNDKLTFNILLKPGNYILSAKLNNACLGGFFMGLDYQKTYLETLSVLTDSDSDGLPDYHEARRKTDPFSADSDQDGLTDYLEVTKYKTNPINPDSDGDGKSDGDWNERREYTYSIKAVVDLRPPFDVAAMNDFFQDARVIKRLPDQVTRVEVVLYPEAKEIIIPFPHKAVDNSHTEATYTKNYSPAMRSKVRDIISNSPTPIHAVHRILASISKEMKHIDIDRDLGYGSDCPLNFNIYRDKNGNIHESGYAKVSQYSIEQIKQKVLFADSMFKLKTYGACGSKSILRGAMLRAAGLPEKTIITIPLLYWYKSDGTIVKVRDEYIRQSNRIDIPDNKVLASDHFFNLVLIGNRWIRVDSMINNHPFVNNKLYIKILDAHDILDHNFTTYWKASTWRQKRPYKYLSIIEQEPRHSRP